MRIINAARGGIVDEEALATPSRRAASPAPVSTCTPRSRAPTRPLFEFDKVVVTPHLGASTDEAQEKAGIAVARSVRLALAGELVPDAVNVQGGVIAEDVRPACRWPRSSAGSSPRSPARSRRSSTSRCAARSPSTTSACSKLAALKGVFRTSSRSTVSYVNAPLFAQERGVEVRLITDPESPDYRNVITLRGTLADGRRSSVSGTLTGPQAVEKIVAVNGFDLELALAEHMAFFATRTGPASSAPSAGPRRRRRQHRRHAGRPRRAGGEALVVLTVDSAIPAGVLAEIATAIGAATAEDGRPRRHDCPERRPGPAPLRERWPARLGTTHLAKSETSATSGHLN